MHPRERAAGGRRARRNTAVFLLLALFASSCSSLDIKPAVSVQKLPLDLKFGVKTETDEPPDVTPPGFPDVEIPTFDPPPPPPPQPPESCVFTKASEAKALVPTIKPDEEPFGATYFWRTQYWGHDAEEPDRHWAFGDPKDVSVRPGTPPNTLVRVDFFNVQSNEPDGYRIQQSEGDIGMSWVFQVAYGDDPTQSDPNIGFFLYRFGIPPEKGVAPEMDDATSQALAQGADGHLTPIPKLKLFSFPVPITQEVEETGYDPFLRTAVVSRTKVLTDERLRECDEHVRAWKIAWQLQLHGFYEHEIRGIFWFATQYGGMLVKAEYCTGAPSSTAEGIPSTTDPCEDESFSGGPLLSGSVRHNIHNIEPLDVP